MFRMSDILPEIEAPIAPPDELGQQLGLSDRTFETLQYFVKGIVLGGIMTLGVAALLGNGLWPAAGATLIVATYCNGFVGKL